MVGRRRKSARKLAASPQRSWLWGRHAVVECLTAGRWKPLEVRLADSLDSETTETVNSLCEAAGLAPKVHTSDQLTRWCGSGEHQGFLAQMPPYPYVDLEAALAAIVEPALVLILDRIQDPHNFGAILRSAEVFGVDLVIVGERSQCEVTPHVARSAAGAVNYVPIARVTDLAAAPRLLAELRQVRTFAASGDAAMPAGECDFTGPCALIIGNEGEGVSRELLSAADGAVRIPQSGRIGSLNAAVAAGVLLYETREQRRNDRRD